MWYGNPRHLYIAVLRPVQTDTTLSKIIKCELSSTVASSMCTEERKGKNETDIYRGKCDRLMKTTLYVSCMCVYV